MKSKFLLFALLFIASTSLSFAQTVPTAPTITGVSTDSQLSVAFTVGTDGGSSITGYKYSTDGGVTWLTRQTGTIASPIVITTLSSDGTTKIVSGTSYSIQIKAVNAIGDGDPSAIFAATYVYLGGGAGTIGSPYLIATPNDLVAAKAAASTSPATTYQTAYYQLTSNINMATAGDFNTFGSYDIPFKGNFNGNGYKISGLKSGTSLSRFTLTTYLGFFGYIDGATISNLSIDVSYYSSSSPSASYNGPICGGLVASTRGTGSVLINNCHVTGTINTLAAGTAASTFSRAGGIIGGVSTTVTIVNSTVNATISATNQNTSATAPVAICGGICALNDATYTLNIVNCSAAGSASAVSTNHSSFAGGIYALYIADNATTNVTNCLATNSVSISAAGTGCRVGGIVSKQAKANSKTQYCIARNTSITSTSSSEPSSILRIGVRTLGTFTGNYATNGLVVQKTVNGTGPTTVNITSTDATADNGANLTSDPEAEAVSRLNAYVTANPKFPATTGVDLTTWAAVAPGVPTSVTATAGNAKASVAFIAPLYNGGATISSYTVTSSPGSFTGSGTTSPITVTGLTNTQAYTFTVTATNVAGTGSGTTSGSVTPDATANILNIISPTTNTGDISLTPVSDVVVGNGALLTINIPTNINSLTIAGGGQVTNTSSLIASAITINSDDTNGTGTYNDNGGTTSVTSATVKQYLSSSRNWYMSSPVSGASSLPIVDGGVTFYSYPESDSRQAAGVKDVYAAGAVWNTVSGATTMTFGTGYIVKPSAATSTVIFSGTGLNTGNQTISGLTYTSANPKHGFNLIGNPYPSYLNVLPSISANSAGVEPTVWYRTRDAAGYYHCETVNSTDGFGTNSSLTGRVTGYIPPMQGFWVRTKSNNQPITFYNSNRSHTTTVTMPGILGTVPTTPLKAPTLKNETYGLLGLNVFNGITGDETIIKFYSGATNNLDAYDSGKMSNGNVNIPELFTVVDGSQLAINTMNSIPYDTEIALGFTTGKSGDFTINASLMSNFTEGTQILLKDNIDQLNPVITDMAKQSYNFNSDITTSNTSRFTLIFKAPSVATEINSTENKIWISTRNGQIVVNGTANRATLEVFNTVGQKVISRILSVTNIQDNNNLPAGAYLVKLTNEGKSITRKIIVD